MNARPTLVVVLLALAAPAASRAQPTPPRQSEDIDLPVQAKKPPPASTPIDEPEELDDSKDTNKEPTLVWGREHRRPDAGELDGLPAPAPRGKRDAGVGDAGMADGGDAALSPFADKQVKAIVMPPADGDAQLLAAWQARRQALDKHLLREVLEQEKKVVRLRQELGYDNLYAIGASLSQEADGLARTEPAEAVRRALLAVELAPDLPAGHWSAVRAAAAEDLTNLRYLGFTIAAFQATWREPRWRAAALDEVAAALLGSLLLAGAALILLVFLRHARYFLHDFHHVFPRGAWRAQTAVAGLLVLALPLLFRLGPVATLFVLALATWLHMTRAEKIVVAALFVVAGLTPLAASAVDRFTTFSGTRAEVVWLADSGGPDESANWTQLQALADRPDAPYEALFVAGRRARRRGDIPTAVVLLRQAAELRSSAPEVLVELGNALFLFGDLDGARETYQRVLTTHEASLEAHYNLARLADRRAQAAPREEAASYITETQSHAHRVIDLDPKIGATLHEPNLQANLFLAGEGLPLSAINEIASAEAHPSWIADEVAARLFGPLPRGWALLAGLALAALLGLWGLLDGVLVPCGPCGKCGRSVCRRCDREVVGPALCGQCVTIFAQRGAVDPSVRARKDHEVKLYQRRRKWVIRSAALALGGAGQVLSGSAPVGLLLLYAATLGGWAVVLRGGLVPSPWGESPALLRAVPGGLALVLAAPSGRPRP